MSGLFGSNAGKAQAKESNAILRENVARLEALKIPTIEAQKIALTDPELIDKLEAEQLSNSALENIQFDPRLRASGLQSLAGTEELAQTGMGAEDYAALAEILRGTSGQAQAQIATGEQALASSGNLDSGAALINRAQANQAAADRASQQGLQVAANAANARRAALGMQSDMSSRLSAQDIGLKTTAGSAKDQIAQFNAQARTGVNAANKAQEIARANQIAGNRSQEEIANKGLIQQKFQNEVQKAGGVGNASGQVAANLQNQAQAAQAAKQAQTSALIGMGTSAATAGMGMYGAAADRASREKIAEMEFGKK